MDEELSAALSYIRLTQSLMEKRHVRLATSRTKLSRHYNKLQHTRAALILVEELLGMLHQDPDKWDDEPELVPF